MKRVALALAVAGMMLGTTIAQAGVCCPVAKPCCPPLAKRCTFTPGQTFCCPTCKPVCKPVCAPCKPVCAPCLPKFKICPLFNWCCW